jgi:glycosyltransferase involved in cell wall biosynthesis
MVKSPGLSVCMIVKNESANMAEALADFRSFADEIVVVDTGSIDNTKEIAAQFTTRIFDFEWIDDFSAARNFAMSKARKTYQLWLDADDRINPRMQGHINSLKSHFDGKKAFYFVLENFQINSPPSFCNQLRCTPLVPGLQFESRIHEQLFPSAVRLGLQLVTTDIVVRHMGYMDDEAKLAKARRNLAILKREVEQGGDHGGLYFFLALTHEPLGERDEAARCMNLALERFEKEYYNHHLIPEGYLFLAKVNYERGDTDQALRSLVKAQSLVNGSPTHSVGIGNVYQALGKHAEAIACYKEVLGKKAEPTLFPSPPIPSDPEILLHIAYSVLCGNDRQTALKLISASAGSGSDTRLSWEWLGLRAFSLKNTDLALFAFETAQRLGGLSPQSWSHLSRIYTERGFFQKAEECLRQSAGQEISRPRNTQTT